MLKRLFHFTCLFHLPGIVKEGIRLGELPLDPCLTYADAPKATNLTTNGSRDDQNRIWAMGCVDKTRIRLTVEIPESDRISFRQFRDYFKPRNKVLTLLAPYHERKHWFYAFGGVSADKIIGVEIWRDGEYQSLNQQELADLVLQVVREKERAIDERVVQFGRRAGANAFSFKPTVTSSWLLDGLVLESDGIEGGSTKAA